MQPIYHPSQQNHSTKPADSNPATFSDARHVDLPDYAPVSRPASTTDLPRSFDEQYERWDGM